MNWNSLVVLVCILLAGFAVWKEFKRKNRSHLSIRIIAVVLAVIALGAIALPLTYQAEVTKADSAEAVLLTGGFHPDSLAKYHAEKLYTLDEKIKSDNPGVIFVNDLTEIKQVTSIAQLRILGDGLNSEELDALGNLPVLFYPEPIEQGMSSVSWKEKLISGEQLKVEGNYKNKSSKKIKLILRNLSTNLDSVIIPAGTTAAFKLQSIPKSTGRNLFNLLVLEGIDTLENEPLPVQIAPAKALKVLMLTASPDFETRFLKDWLAKNGYALAVRSAISKDKFNTTFTNLVQFPLDHLSKSTLEKSDVLVADLNVLKTLNAADADALQTEITQKGLGVIIRADSTMRSKSFFQGGFSTERLTAKDSGPVSLVLQGRAIKTAKLNTGSLYLGNPDNTQSLINDESGHVYAAATQRGAGKQVFTLLNNTFSWLLAGNKIDYADVWSLLLSKAARKSAVTESWQVLSQIPTVSEPVNLQLESSTKPVAIKIDSFNVAAKQDGLIPFIWNVSYHPKFSGWQNIKTDGGSLNSFYIYNEKDWTDIRIQKRQFETKAFADASVIPANVTKQIHQKVTIAVSKIYFYLLLLLACGFLWAEAKFKQY